MVVVDMILKAFVSILLGLIGGLFSCLIICLILGYLYLITKHFAEALSKANSKVLKR